MHCMIYATSPHSFRPKQRVGVMVRRERLWLKSMTWRCWTLWWSTCMASIFPTWCDSTLAALKPTGGLCSAQQGPPFSSFSCWRYLLYKVHQEMNMWFCYFFIDYWIIIIMIIFSLSTSSLSSLHHEKVSIWKQGPGGPWGGRISAERTEVSLHRCSTLFHFEKTKHCKNLKLTCLQCCSELDQPSAYHLTIYRYANIVWFSKYRWNIVIVFFFYYTLGLIITVLLSSPTLYGRLLTTTLRVHTHIFGETCCPKILFHGDRLPLENCFLAAGPWKSSYFRELFPPGLPGGRVHTYAIISEGFSPSILSLVTQVKVESSL